jgi:uncharacterized protein YecT (DUF1311 family)
MRAFALFLALLLAALPARAEQLEADTDTIESCMTTAWPRDVLALCVGVVANPCQEAEDPYTTVEMNRCLGREAAAWEAMMGRLWPKMLTRAREIDAANETAGLGHDSAAETLAQAQRAWTVFRDAQCRHNYASWSPGDFRSVAYAACLLDVTARRSVDFYGLLMAGG